MPTSIRNPNDGTDDLPNGPVAGDKVAELAGAFADYSEVDFDVTMTTRPDGSWTLTELVVSDAVTPLSSSEKDTIEPIIGWRP